MTPLFEVALVEFQKLNKMQKVGWLSKLIFFVSMFARDTYEVGGNAVVKPERLRKFNELLHRISDFQMGILFDRPNIMPDRIFFEILSECISELDLQDATLLTTIS
ncbi:MAG: hypothetical protein WAO71_08465 [Gallionella sp.]